MNSRIEEIEGKIRETVEEEQMFPDGCSVVAGVSGGADSMMLIHFLTRFAKDHGITLTAAHINHGLRGKEADADEAFVAAWCAEKQVAFQVLHADVAALAKKNSQGVEECGRNVRYTFFRQLCGPSGRIATAHTLTDSAETVLMNFAKGAGANGLSGIPPVRGRIVRPLIRITRAEVETYCRHYGLSFVTDSTNLTDEYMRNRIRHIVMPVLRGINPGFEQAVFRTTRLFRQDERYFQDTAQKELERAADPVHGGYSIENLQRQPDSVLFRMIALAVHRETEARLDYEHIAAVAERIRSGKGNITLPGGIQCYANGNTLFVISNDVHSTQWKVPLQFPETHLPDGRVLRLNLAPLLKNRGKINNLLFNNGINYDTILKTDSFIRNRIPGDRFCPAGRGVTKTLKKLFNEQKIPPFRRGQLALLESGGEILWIEGIGPSQKAAVTGNTRQAAEIIIKEC